MPDSTDMTVAGEETARPPAPFTLVPTSLAEALELAKLMASSDMVPQDYRNKPANVLMAVQMGHELGLKPLQAVQNIAIVNGRPTVYGDALIALVRASAVCEGIHEEFAAETMTATCTAKRRGEPEQTRSFSQADAQAAGLWGRQGPWKQYPKRMLQMRARSWCLRDLFPDVLKGLSVAEEVRDYIDVTPAPTGESFTSTEAPSRTKRVAAKLSERAQAVRQDTGQGEAQADAESPAGDPEGGSPGEPDTESPAPRVAEIMTMIAQAATEDDLEACSKAVNRLDAAQRRKPGRALVARVQELKREIA